MSSEFRDELLQSYSDAELLRHIVASPRHPFPPGEAHGPFPSRIRTLSENLLAKGYDREHLPEVTRAVEVAHRLGIRVPQILRIVRGEDDWGYCIMERIHGPTLAEAWAKLGWFTTVRLALQLRRFVRLLRSVTSTTAGQLVTGRCYSFYLDDLFGLPDRPSVEDVVGYIQFWARFTTFKKEVEARRHGRTGPPPQITPMGDTFVLVHHDLKAQNLVLGPSGQLWVIDWDLAGFYPIYFEYAGMRYSHGPGWNRWAYWRWRLFCWIAAGPYEKAAKMLSRIEYKTMRCQAGRRFELLKNGGPTRRRVS